MYDQIGDLSRLLYAPVTLLLYGSAAALYLYALTTRVALRGDGAVYGRRVQQLAGLVAVLGVAAHVGHEVLRAIAQDRLPLGNMFEFSSAMALVGVVGGLAYLQFVRKRPELNGFVLLGGTLVVASAMLVYAEPGPLQPILDTWWRAFHVSLIVGAAGILTFGFVFNALYLLRHTAERKVGPSGGGPNRGGGTAGGRVPAASGGVMVTERVAPDAPLVHDGPQPAYDAAYRQAMRATISPARLALGTFLGTSVIAWVFLATPVMDLRTGITRFVTVNAVVVGAALVGRWFVPYLPAAATLDAFAYRIIALGFFVWTFGVIAGAMWAEQSWGRFWGWDPKETGSFLTWVAYAAYLHARATRGAWGRGAGWIGLAAYGVLMITYWVVNLVVSGTLHGYAGL